MKSAAASGRSFRAGVSGYLQTLLAGMRAALIPAAAILVSFLLGAVLLIATGQNPLDAYAGLFEGAFGNRNAVAGTLATTTPLVFTALSFLVAIRAGIFNAGSEGQLIVGAFSSALMGFGVQGLPSLIHIPLVVIAGFVGGAAWGLIPAALKLLLKVNDLVTTLMMNYVAVLLCDYLTLNVFRSPTVQAGTNAQTITIAAGAKFPSIFPPYSVTFALPLGIILAVIVYLILSRTIFGYELRMSGQQANFSRYGGISVRRTQFIAMIISGGLAGIGGAAHVGGIFFAYVSPFTEGLGFNGVLIALLVRNSPLLVPLGAFFFGALQSGALKMQIFTNVSRYIIGVLTALIILLASAQQFTKKKTES